MPSTLPVYVTRFLSLALPFVASAAFVGCDEGDTLPEDADLDGPSADVECVDAADEVVIADGADSVPAVTLELDGGWTFAWYESNADGFSEFATSEVGPAGGKLPSSAYPGLLDLSPTEQWSALTDAPVPQTLRDYEERYEAAPVQRPSTGAGFCEGSSEPMASQGSVIVNRNSVPCDAALFDSSYCNSGSDFEVCLLDHWNGAWASHSNMRTWYSVVCPEQGDVKHQISTGGIPIWIVTANQGELMFYVWNKGYGSAQHRRTDITHASGDKFQLSVTGRCYGAC